MKNLLDDPDVKELYEFLRKRNYESIDDYLDSTIDKFNLIAPEKNRIHKIPDRKVWIEGVEVSDYIESDDYGL